MLGLSISLSDVSYFDNTLVSYMNHSIVTITSIRQLAHSQYFAIKWSV